MAGEMTQEDLDKGGDWYETRLKMESFCNENGLSCEVKPFDQYQGPYGDIVLEGVVVGELWCLFAIDSEPNHDGYLVVAKEGRNSESLEVYSSEEIKAFLLDTRKDWNMGYNPEEPGEDDVVVLKGDFLEITDPDGRVGKYKLSEYKEELSLITKHYQEQTLKYNNQYYIMID